MFVNVTAKTNIAEATWKHEGISRSTQKKGMHSSKYQCIFEVYIKHLSNIVDDDDDDDESSTSIT